MFSLIRDIILATDLAHHLKILQDIKKMAKGKIARALFSLMLSFVDFKTSIKNSVERSFRKKTT